MKESKKVFMKGSIVIKLYLVGIFVFSGFSLLSQDEKSQNVLFVGNSYTYFWNLPHQVQGFAESENIPLSTSQSTSGGVTLGHHWRGDRGLKTIELIKKSEYDFVVLQDHSRRTIDAPDSLMYFAGLINEVAKSTGSKVLLYMTWAREWDPYMQETITREYTNVAGKLNAEVVPVGLAWERARSLRPELKLYDEDGSHPSSLGSYLSACVFYAVLTDNSPVGLPRRLISKDIDGEKLYLNIQSAETALFCQKVAQEIVGKFKN